MSWVKQAKQMQAGLSKPDAKALPPESPLKDPLKDDLDTPAKLKPAAQSTADGVSALVKKAKDAVIDQGGTDIKTHDALVKTVTQFAGESAAEAARAELMEEVKAADKRVARSLQDTVEGDGGAASIMPVMAAAPVRTRGEDEEEEEDEQDTPVVESSTSDG